VRNQLLMNFSWFWDSKIYGTAVIINILANVEGKVNRWRLI
jgi:hypothetical protein